MVQVPSSPSSSSSTSRVRIEFAPKPGFCIKTSTLGGAIPSPTPLQPHAQTAEKLPSSLTSVPEGLKVFVNIAWDPKAPPSPKGSEEAILRALEGDDVDVEAAAGLYIPAIVSPAREDTDKAGNPSLVFDCVYNTTIKARTLHNPEFRTFLIELSIQRIEAQAGLILSRDIRTPNISSKGKLGPRTVEVPASLFLETPLASTTSSAPKLDVLASPTETADKTEIQSPSMEVNLLKQPLDPSASTTDGDDVLSPLVPVSDATTSPALDWSWTKDDNGKLRIEIQLPGLTSTLVEAATLDIEPRKLLMVIPKYGSVNIDLDLSDAEISSQIQLLSKSTSDESVEKRRDEETMRVLRLKRERDFDVEAAEAEWKIGTGVVVIHL
ncbi:pre-RNA processing PIH1/Nop17-domain-containing protein [Pholiota molesta]|nr:pre-RNA processing PIH1/Nop17-domain-containing protein [Pholiota molesta]